MTGRDNPSVLVTGGAGFIGTALCRELLTQGYRIRILDNFNPQIHGRRETLAEDLQSDVDLVRGDVRNADDVARALAGVKSVVHLAAETGTGQSMYEISRYVDTNILGTANLLQQVLNGKAGTGLKSIIVASSRAIYGEGGYQCNRHGTVYPETRPVDALKAARFEPTCPECGGDVSLIETDERAPFKPMSIYGLTKQVQEQAVLMLAKMLGINGFALRYQNVYGPGQSLKNPYTGILAVFSNLARLGHSIEIFEDGRESRDFVFIRDAVAATAGALAFAGRFVGALNVGSGSSVCVEAVARAINAYFGNRSKIQISGAFRLGDIRHNRAAIARLQSVLGLTPTVQFADGLRNFLAWVETQPVEESEPYRKSLVELQMRGLMDRANCT